MQLYMYRVYYVFKIIFTLFWASLCDGGKETQVLKLFMNSNIFINSTGATGSGAQPAPRNSVKQLLLLAYSTLSYALFGG